MTTNATTAAGRSAARRSLEALALGDAFGERWFPLFRAPRQAVNEIRARRTPPEPRWQGTDDTALALALTRSLDEHGHVDQDHLALCYALAFDADQARGYGHGMHLLLPRLLEAPADWRTLAPGLFDGGSLGNGAAMRVAPLGARFHEDLDHVAAQAVPSAGVTHAHPDGIAGAVAVAVAAALSARGELVLDAAAARTPQGPVRAAVRPAPPTPFPPEPWQPAAPLGHVQRLRAADTVPFALWTATRHRDDLEAALWATAEGLGDVDTTCAITGGVVGAATGTAGAPEDWLRRREPLG